jgi:hypothetical protein
MEVARERANFGSIVPASCMPTPEWRGDRGRDAVNR